MTYAVTRTIYSSLMASFSPTQSYNQPGEPHQEVAWKTSKPLEESVATLLIRHLPEAIPHDTIFELFSHYGASSVRACNGGRMKNCAFADFKDKALACQAQRQLNGLRFLGRVLSAEKAVKRVDDDVRRENKHQFVSDSASPCKSLVEGVKSKLSPAAAIASKLGVDYPFPPHLEYVYPPPDGNILTNIVNALIAVPRFYTQVLHLMNKMNIPAPFRMALPTPPLPPLAPPPLTPPPPMADPSRSPMTNLSADESEMESSDEETNDKTSAAGDLNVIKPARKRIKREAIVGPAVDKDVGHEAVGLKPSSLVPKEIPVIKKKNPVLQIKITPKQLSNEVLEDDIIETTEQKKNREPYAMPEEIEKGRLPPEEILSLPMFKNYTAGNPASVLYVKNLAKDVVLHDFYFIFGSLFGSIDAAKSSLNVKLMQEGRMRGQAFVTFPSIELAQDALNLVNGYVFKGKPMIIQFGRSPATKTN